eukprot:scaffold9577_cov95-Skeletonema_marinoi.AAC.3
MVLSIQKRDVGNVPLPTISVSVDLVLGLAPTACPTGTSSEIVDGKSQCVCDNGAIDPWPSSVSLVNVKRALQEKRMLDLFMQMVPESVSKV